MPSRLLKRCGPDTIGSFRAAAIRRYEDGLVLAATGHRETRTAAIYLWGYAVEMVLKAAVFEVFGYPEGEVITYNDRKAVEKLSESVELKWPKAQHAIDSWGQLLVRFRAVLPGHAYRTEMASEILIRSFRVYQLWRETLRYHANVAYPHELAQVREQTEWFLRRVREL